MIRADDEVLAQCESEPIEFPGAIHDFGFLLAVDPETMTIVAASQNVERLLAFTTTELIGKHVRSIFGSVVHHDMRNKLGYSTIATRRELFATHILNANRYQLYVHTTEKLHIIEGVRPSLDRPELQDRVAGITVGLQSTTSLQQIFELAVSNVHAICEYHRVMFYRFLPDGSGEGVAERRSGHMEPMLGLRYPAWDIPERARKLYASTPIRVIAHMRRDDIPLDFSPAYAVEDLVLSQAVLRGTSTVHREYLTNMGISATITVPIVVEKKLWGLIACHHEEPHTPDLKLLDAMELCGHILSFAVTQQLDRDRRSYAEPIAAAVKEVVSLRTRLLSESEFLSRISETCQPWLAHDGVAVFSEGHWTSEGLAADVLSTDWAALAEIEPPLYWSHELPTVLPAWNVDAVPGAMLLGLGDKHDLRLLFLRGPVEQTLTWAGSPKKDIVPDEDGVRLSPRKSFAKYQQLVNGKSEEWSLTDVAFARQLLAEGQRGLGMAGTVMQQKDNLRILANELNHRVKNILALGKSLAAQSKVHAVSPESYADSLERRLFSLSAAHELLIKADMTGVALADIVSAELQPYVPAERLTALHEQPAIIVHPDIVAMVALLMHELTSNAVKHGALSVASGRVTVTWQVVAGELQLDWKETGGPPATRPSRTGFGMELLEKALPYEFGGTVDIQFERQGFGVRYHIPVKGFVADQLDTSDRAYNTHLKESGMSATLIPNRALVVEDSYLIAAEHSDALERAGVATVDCASSVDIAASLIEKRRYDLALLDINLRGELSFPLAEILDGQSVPTILITGYGDSDNVPQHLKHLPVLRKPLDEEALSALLLRQQER